MMPAYVRLDEDTRRVVRRRLRIGTSMAVWWCPFCDHSQVEGQTACGKCGALACDLPVVTSTVATIVETAHQERGDVVPSRKPTPPAKPKRSTKGRR